MRDTKLYDSFSTPLGDTIQRLLEALDGYWSDDDMRAPSEGEIEHLIRNGYTERWNDGEIEIDDVAVAIRLMRDVAGIPRGGSKERTVQLRPGLKAQAFAEIAHLEASRNEEVISFREEELGGNLLIIEEVPEWVAATTKEDGPATTYIRIPKDAEAMPRTTDDYRALGGVETSADILEYPGTGERFRAVAVRADGTLDWLCDIARSLARSWGWPEGSAVAFILTGCLVAPIRGTATFSVKYPYPARSTVTIEVVADSVSKSEVADLYAQVVKEGDFSAAAGVGRPMGHKNARLAVAAAKHAQSERTWGESMRIWNATEGDDWNYVDAKRFGHDAREAFKRVTGQRLAARNQLR